MFLALKSQLQKLLSDGIMRGNKPRLTTVLPESDGLLCGRIYYER
jgi:hypothetical protein